MSKINIFYIFTLFLGCVLFALLQPMTREEISFYGFAENLETEVNYNYAVVINRILVKPGQNVSKGDTLLYLTKINKKMSLADQDYKISTLKAEQALWLDKKQNQIDRLTTEHNAKIRTIQLDIEELNEKLDYKQNIVNSLGTIAADSSIYTPLKNKINYKKSQIQELHKVHDKILKGLQSEITQGTKPYQSRISLLKAEQEFDQNRSFVDIAVMAPSDGLIGNVHCKEEEHIPPFKSLLTFYEPHSSIVHGYVHEDLVLQVNIGDHFTISSLKEGDIQYHGEVIGLGSRIVEIPSRLRKISDLKTYGRKVFVEIPSDNVFLQKEKVGLQFISFKQSSGQ